MTDPHDREEFRRLPDRVPVEDTVESVATESRPLGDPAEERDRLLREAWGGG
jgi:hypothetical protein